MNKGQGALEYLLLIGGAILVAVIVISILVGIGGSSGDETLLATAHGLCAKYPDNECATHSVDVKSRSFYCFSQGPSQCRATKGTPITACEDSIPITWALNGKYYLANDVSTNASYCFSITAANVALNCETHKVTSNTGDGIRLVSGNTTIKYCNIVGTGGSYGLIAFSSNNTLQNNNVCGSFGLRQIQLNNISGQSASSSGNICNTCNDTSTPSKVCNVANTACQITC